MEVIDVNISEYHIFGVHLKEKNVYLPFLKNATEY